MALILADLRSFVRFAAEHHCKLPIFMVGRSRGGLIALDYAIDCGAIDCGAVDGAALEGLVLSGPAVTTTAGSALARRLAGALSALVPDLGVTALGADLKISRAPEGVRAYQEDPLVYHGRVKARTGAEILAAMERLPARLPRLSVPLLALHGTHDQICPLAGSAMVHDAVSSPDRTLRRYPGLYHEVFNEPEREAILTDLICWLTDRSTSHSAGVAGSSRRE